MRPTSSKIAPQSVSGHLEANDWRNEVATGHARANLKKEKDNTAKQRRRKKKRRDNRVRRVYRATFRSSARSTSKLENYVSEMSYFIR